jgi:membrane fusion protein (multidrug efflux system)
MAAIAAGAASHAAGPPAPGQGPPPLVKVAPVTAREVNPPASYVGHVEPLQVVDLRARVEGALEWVDFREGGEVQAGALLYRIEPAPYQARVESEEANVAQAEAVLEKARQYLARTEAVGAGGLAAADLDNARADERRARAALDAARASLKLARINLAYTSVKAPIGGRIGRSFYTRGNLVNPASGPLARIVQTDPVRVLFSVSENAMAAFSPGHNADRPAPTVRIQFPDGRLAENSGRIDFVDNAVDPQTGSIAVRALFDNRNGALTPGQYVILLVRSGESRSMPVVRQSAVMEDREGRYVLVVDPQGKVEQRRVATGPLVEDAWAIASGLAAGETVVVEGVQKARPGQTVRTAVEP